MKKLNLKTFERKITTRRLRIEDYEAVRDMQLLCFPAMKPWSREQFESQQKHFPEGQLCVEYKGRIVASSCSLIVDFDFYSEWHDWKLIADGGYIRNHNPQGDTLYGIEIMVHPEFRGMKLARRLYNERKLLVRKKNLKRIVIGGRIPGYKKHKKRISASAYVKKVMDKTYYDLVLTPQLSNGFILQGLITDYFPSDEDSAGYATHLEWLNPDYVPDAKPGFHFSQLVRVCAVQYQMRTIGSFEEFAQQATYFVDVASDYHCDFVLFPELFTLQLLSCTSGSRPGEAARLLADMTPQYLDLFTKMAIKYNINIVGGSQFVIEDEKLYNISYLFRRDGTLDKQYKLHITPSERKWWGVMPGNKMKVFDTDRGRIAINVCYDIEFPELARIAAHKGAQIIFCPFNTDERHGYLRIRYCAQARCIENHLYVVTSGCVGNLPFVDNADIHYAQSGIFTPSDLPFSRDAIAAECTPNIETVVMHDLDLEGLRRHQRFGSTQNWNDRRTDIYKLKCQEDEVTIEI